MENLQSEMSVVDRLTGPTSPFFKPLVYGGAITAALSAALAVFHSYLTERGIPLPAVTSHVAEIVAYVSLAVAGVSKMTVDFNIKKVEGQ